ncbi:hypothetical protein JVU11DRAFT_4984 [Chiua virens]|nr:hypothetical protein JVU11DRAFT_4984 [Chiua virens]
MDPSEDNDSARTSHENLSSSILSRSIIPDPLGELPAWFKKETDMAAANISTFRIKYPLHNSNGPRWYKNHHLLPPSAFNPPSSFFSPAFPPMAPSVHSLHDRSEDSGRLPGPSRSPSSTPLPTPSSSQVRIPDPGVKPRSRKTSRDKRRFNGYHSVSPVSVDSPEGIPRTRSRLSSMNTGQTRRKTVTPSPLSQSTSALHLQSSEPAHVTRKLSKRRKPVLGGLFGTHEKDAPEATDTSPAEDSSSGVPKRSSVVPNGGLHITFSGSKRHSTLSPMSISANGSTAALSSHSSLKHDKRQSVLGRLVRKFSILRRSSQDAAPTTNEWSEGVSGVALSAVDEQSSRRSFVSQRQPSPEKLVAEKKASGPSKRIPPPRIDSDLEPKSDKGPSIEAKRDNSDRNSSISYDVPFSPLGKLTIANPDAPSSGGTTPVKMNNVLPSEPPSELLPDPKSPVRVVPSPHRRNASHVGLAPSGPSSAGRSSPIPGLLSPISVAAPAISLPDLSQFMSASYSAPSRTSSSVHSSTYYQGHSIKHLQSPPEELSRPILPHLALPVVNDSPLSKASVLVNPPTPYNTDEPHPELPVFEKTPRGRSGQNEQSPDVSLPKQASPTREAHDQQLGGEIRLTKSNSTTSRKTETYKLVRTLSDKVSTSSEAAFQAEGDQWLVVNSDEVPRRRKVKERVEKAEKVEKPSSRTSQERERRRRQEKAAQHGDETQRRTTSQANTKPPVDKADSGSLSGRPGRARSLDTPQRPTLVQPLIFTLQDEPPRLRKSDDRPRDSLHRGHSKTARPGPSPIVAVARVDRLPSMSARPTSELTPAADMKALKAREAWEMDRLWKGRSMVQGQPETGATPSPSSTEPKAANETAKDMSSSMQSFAYGSSHTSYVVQPLQAHPIPASVFYANMPTAPPPIIYAATAPYAQPHASSSRDYTAYRTPPNSFTFPSQDTSADPPRNPLPVPPRESNYQPTLLPALPDRSNGSASEYWGKYTNMPSHS